MAAVFDDFEFAVWNQLLHELLIHCEVLHPRRLIDQVDMRLLLLLCVIIDIRLGLKGHCISLCLKLLVHLLEG